MWLDRREWEPSQRRSVRTCRVELRKTHGEDFVGWGNLDPDVGNKDSDPTEFGVCDPSSVPSLSDSGSYQKEDATANKTTTRYFSTLPRPSLACIVQSGTAGIGIITLVIFFVLVPPSPSPIALEFKKKCTCHLGKGATGLACPKNGTEFCSSCSPGNRLVRGQCLPIQCFCPFGEPATGQNCAAVGAHKCDSCNDGYVFAMNGSCLRASCLCSHGHGARGLACRPVEEFPQTCASCFEGYHLVNESCFPKKQKKKSKYERWLDSETSSFSF